MSMTGIVNVRANVPIEVVSIRRRHGRRAGSLALGITEDAWRHRLRTASAKIWAYLPMTVSARDLYALINTVEAATELLDSRPEGAPVPEWALVRWRRLRQTLDRYQP